MPIFKVGYLLLNVEVYKQMSIINKYFYCYSPYLRKHIESQGIQSIVESVNPNTNSRFRVYEQTEELSEAIKSYKRNKKQ